MHAFIRIYTFIHMHTKGLDDDRQGTCCVMCIHVYVFVYYIFMYIYLYAYRATKNERVAIIMRVIWII